MQSYQQTATSRPGRTVAQFEEYTAQLQDEYMLTTAGKALVRCTEWSFQGNDYNAAWQLLFTRARQLGVRYCKHFKRFYKPLPPKPNLGDKVLLTRIRASGVVTGFRRFDILVTLDSDGREIEVSREFLTILP